MIGDATSLQEEPILGKFVSIGTVIWTYLGGNYISLIRNFGVLLTLLAVYAVVTLLVRRQFQGHLPWWTTDQGGGGQFSSDKNYLRMIVGSDHHSHEDRGRYEQG
jgi:hypothetical protein